MVGGLFEAVAVISTFYEVLSLNPVHLFSLLPYDSIPFVFIPFSKIEIFEKYYFAMKNLFSRAGLFFDTFLSIKEI